MIGVPEAATSALPGFFVASIKRVLTYRSQARCEPVRIDAFQRRLVGGEGEFAELLHFVDDQLVDADLGDRQHVVLARLQPVEIFFQSLLHPLDALAREPVGAVDALEEVGIGLDLIADQPAFKFGRGRNELERRMGDDDAVPLRGRRSAPETAGACP